MRSDFLEVIPTRLATEGQELAIHTFLNGTVGFAPPEAVRRFHKLHRVEPGLGNSVARLLRRMFHLWRATPTVPAIYVPDGTRVILKGIPADMQTRYAVQCVEGASLVETHGSPNWLRFTNGRQIFLRDLADGMLLEVLSLAETEYAMCDQDLAVHTPAF
jgi:hypothetical protein